jgi:hypothetical protein
MLDSEEEQKTPSNNELIQQIEEDRYIQEDFAKVMNSGQVNLELAQEILSILQEIENPLFATDFKGNKYLDYETESISYNLLRRAGESEAGRLIKNKRRLDLVQYANIPTTLADKGVELVFKNPDYQPSKEEKALLRQWTIKILDNLFFPPNDKFANFGKFIGGAYEDFFDLDDITIEIRRDSFGTPVAIHLQDPIIYKPVIKPIQYYNQYPEAIDKLLENFEKLYDQEFRSLAKNDIPDFLLIYNNQRIAQASIDYVRKFHFFVRSQFQKAQRGFSIVEQALKIINYINNALRMNATNFTNSRLPQGFFAFTGGVVQQSTLEKLKKILYANQNGANNSSRFPLINIKGDRADVKWVGVRNNSRDMEYHQFMTLLFSIFCQLSGTDPRELALGSYGDAVGKSSLFSEPTDGIKRESKDVGARTFLTHLADSLNSPNKYGANIFQELTKMDVKIRFTGFEVEDASKKLEIKTKELSTTKSINDLLSEEDEEKQELKLGDVNIYDVKGFANPQVFQTLLFNAQQKQQQAQPPQQGMPMPEGAGEEMPPEEGQENQENEEKHQGFTDRDKELIKKYQGKAEIPKEILSKLGLNNEEDSREEAS